MGNDPLYYCINYTNIPEYVRERINRDILTSTNKCWTPQVLPKPYKPNPFTRIRKTQDLIHNSDIRTNSLVFKRGNVKTIDINTLEECHNIYKNGYQAPDDIKITCDIHLADEYENIGLDMDYERSKGIQIRDIGHTTIIDWRKPHLATQSFIEGEQSTGKTNMSEAMLRLQAKKETIDVNTIGISTVGLNKVYNIFEPENVLTDCEITTIPDNEPPDNQYVKGDPFPEISDTFDEGGKTSNNVRIYENLVRELRQDLELTRNNKNALERRLHEYASRYEQNLSIGRNDAIVKMGKMLPHLQLLDNVPPEQLTELIRILKTYDFKQLQTNKKAVQLLKEWLTNDEWEELLQHKYVTIKSKNHKNRYYRVFENPDEKVQVLQKGFGGAFKKMERLCGLISNYRIPEGDKLVNKIMTIKTNEDYFLKNSNKFDSYD